MYERQTSFEGLRVAAFESRRKEEMARLIERFGGIAHVSPSMQEVPLSDNPAAVDFAHRLLIGQIDIVIFTTATGFHHLIGAVERHVDRQKYLDALADAITIVRGPKPAAAMRQVGLTPSHTVPEPNTWREILATVDQGISVANQRVALQEYGKTNPSLIAGLEARGAEVTSLRVYDWELPDDTRALEANVRRLAREELDVAMFTSAQQVVNLFSFANRLGLADSVRRGLRQTVVASIGPTTSQRLRDNEIPVDTEPSHPKMGQFVSETAGRAASILRRKRHVSALLSRPAGNLNQPHAAWHESRFMRACRRQACDTTPIWLMRQAGRYLPEYRAIREKMSFIELCKNPALCCEVMVKTVDRLGVDAAIIFSDLLPILEPMGLDLEYAHGEGPVIHNPVRESCDVDRVLELESTDSLHFVMETVRQTRAALPDAIPVIGFAGAPFTLASYVIEGGASRNYLHTKTLMYRDEGAWRALMERLARAVTAYLNAQIAAGAQCVQLFDSWVGCLNPDDYRRHVLPHVQRILSGIVPGVPVINFATGNPALLPCQAEGGGAVVGVDWRIRLDTAWQMVGYDTAIQGNLDPTALFADVREIRRRAGQIVQQAGGRPGHIFNLGHGVLPQTPVDHVIALVDAVHELGERSG
jgi:uroporphyrinogen decarboxylase